MKPIKKTYLQGAETLDFNSKNGHLVERYYKPEKFNLKKEEPIKLWFSDNFDGIPQKLSIRAIYYDSSKKIENHEGIEYEIATNIQFPEKIKRYEKSEVVPTKIGSKVLWKVVLKADNNSNTKLYMTLTGDKH